MSETLTGGRRIYAIGDVHGCLDHLRRAEASIRLDLLNRPHPHPLIILVGDYTDRGPESRGVIDHLIAMRSSGPETICLYGNHDHCFLDYWHDPLATSARLHWLNPRMGGEMTLISYGVTGATHLAPERSHAAFRAAVPDSHVEFLTTLPTTCRAGAYLFVHAGIRPGVPLDRQKLMDLIWIREGFLDSTADFGATIVHGHTIVDGVERRPNRIAIDTGAVFGGALSVLVLEGSGLALLDGADLRPLHPWTPGLIGIGKGG
jgi:serine/threonine protein phosphatase 1